MSKIYDINIRLVLADLAGVQLHEMRYSKVATIHALILELEEKENVDDAREKSKNMAQEGDFKAVS